MIKLTLHPEFARQPVAIQKIAVSPQMISVAGNEMSRYWGHYAQTNALITMESAQANRMFTGTGEAAPHQRVTGDNFDSISNAVSRLAPQIINQSLSIEGLRDYMTKTQVRYCAAAAVEYSFFTILAALNNTSVPALFTNSSHKPDIETAISIPPVDSKTAATIAHHYTQSGFKRFKVKIGRGVTEDAKRVMAVWRVLEGSQNINGPTGDHLLIEASEIYNTKEAKSLLELLAALGRLPRYFEQPLRRDDQAGLSDLAGYSRKLGIKLIADESLVDQDTAKELAKTRLFDGFNIKLAKQGGILGALEMVQIALNHGLELMMGCNVEGGIAMMANIDFVHLVGAHHFSWIDLDAPFLVSSTTTKDVIKTSPPFLNHASNS